MRNLYEKQGVLFSLIWIFAYAFVMAPVKDIFGTGNIWTLLALLAFASVITVFVKANHLEEKCGIARWPANTKACLYFIPMWVLATGNLWFGFTPEYHGMTLMIAALSMILVGYVEEMIFRGFLFRAMLASVKPAMAIAVSALTFGIGHIVNLFAGQAGFDTVLQVAFAVCWGFILTMVFYKSGSLIPCIIAHAMIDVFSLFAADSRLGNGIYTGTTAVGAIVYCVYLGRMRIQAEK
jgi:membrane protease YdiL (CAAX protease family)